MRCKIVFIALAVLIVSINILQSDPQVKISEEVFEKIDDGNVSVFIELTPQKNIQSDEILDSIKIEHKFNDVVSATISKKDLRELELNPVVESVELVGIKKIFLQDSVPLINATSVWPIQINNLNLTGAGETICILDTGTNFSHPDLIGKNLTCVIDCTGVGCVQNCSVSDGNGHGTHVAGIIGANGLLKGVAPNVNLISVKVCNVSGSCREDWIKDGIDWCTDNLEEYNISVISMSLGGGQYNSYCDVEESYLSTPINNAVAKNISVVVAAGNVDGTYTNAISGIASPACIQNATRVTATDKNDAFASFAFRHQNFSDILTAPGVLINSTWNNGLYSSDSGTSMSTPHVAGAIALINQFKKLETGRPPTKDEIKNSLINSGKKIFDPETNTNFSRIDIYSAVFYLDVTAPNINLISPQNNTINSSATQIFRCNATDLLQLANLTLKIWNSTGIYFENTTNASSNFLVLEQNADLEVGQYHWGCISSDIKNNLATSGNFTISTGNLIINLNFPTSNSKTNQNQTFTCSTISANELSNVTFYFWNFSNLEYNETKNISGKQNSTQFNYNFSSEGDYRWNCFFSSVDNSSFAISNYSLIYDVTKPNITLINPENSFSATGSQTVNFQFNASDNSEIANCSLMIDDVFIKSNESHMLNSTNTIQYFLSSGNYNWKINCIDCAGNSKNSSLRNLTINEASSSSSSSSSGGGGGGTVSTSKTIKLTEDEIEQGTTKELKVNDRLNFNVNNQTHELKLDSAINSEATITVSSNPITFTIAVNQSRKINFDNDEFYDLEISLLSIENSKAKINLVGIHEEIPVKKIFTNNETENENSKITGSAVNENENEKGFIWNKIADFFKKIFEWFEEKIR